tara:strand:- start:1082 stop:1873 length:792 start_codon:yes stop_codon:yes gene_type:complete
MNKVSASKVQGILGKVKSKAEKLPLRIVIYGREGVGKTSFPAHMKNPLYLISRGETGLQTLVSHKQLGETDYLPPIEKWEDFISTLNELNAVEHEYKTLVLDCLNGFEKLLMEFTIRTHYDGDLNKFLHYHKGYATAASIWAEVTVLLDRLRVNKKMTIVCLAHSKIAKERNPVGEDYQTFKVDLHDLNSASIREWADIVMFFNFMTAVDDKGKGKGGRQRVAYCEPDAGYEAKNRTGLPSSFPLGSSAAEGFKNFVKLFTKE